MHMPVNKQEEFNNKIVRNWTLYVVKFNDGQYYIGITSRRDFMVRINQHGSELGARINRGKFVESVEEIHPLGKLTMLEAQNIENDMTLEYRKRYGWNRVKGGYDISLKTSIFPTYTPGSPQATALILSCLAISIVFLLALIIIYKG